MTTFTTKNFSHLPLQNVVYHVHHRETFDSTYFTVLDLFILQEAGGEEAGEFFKKEILKYNYLYLETEDEVRIVPMPRIGDFQVICHDYLDEDADIFIGKQGYEFLRDVLMPVVVEVMKNL